MAKKILEEVLNGDIKNFAQRNGVSQQEITTILKDLGKELKSENPTH